MNAAVRLSAFILLNFLYFNCQGQIFGGNSPKTAWRQINTNDFRIIFPKDLDTTARRIANVISTIKDSTLNTIGNKKRKINIVLQNQTTISNGYVGLGPFRSEYYLMPSQNSFNLGSLPWMDMLAIHEYRHVQQYTNFDVGLSKVMSTLFGQEGQALANAAAIPDWFFEGDAVYNETNLSKQGRGSLPFFYNGFRSLWQEGKDYSWMKLRNGSLKDYVPDHYQLGFLLTAYGYQKYGNQFWKNVTQDAASFKNLTYPFQHAIEKYAGVNYVAFRRNALSYFKTEFKIDSNTQQLNKNEEYQNELYPHLNEKGEIIFLKNTFKTTSQFTIRSSENKDRKIRTSDYTIDKYFSYRNGKIIYASYIPDVRWGNENYSDLQILDVNTGAQRSITKHTKYFSPDINESGSTIVAVNVADNLKSNLHILNAQTGKIEKILPNNDAVFYTYPKFISTNTIVSPVRNEKGEMSIALINYESAIQKYLIPFTYNVIGWPYYFKDTLYFSYAYKKNDALFAYTFRDEKLWQVNGIKNSLGYYHPSVNDSDVVWHSFTSDGNRVRKMNKKDISFQEINMDKLQTITSSFGIPSLNGNNANLLYSAENDSFPITKYAKTHGLVHFHSMEPAINDPQYTLSLVSENILNTLQSNISLTYDRAEKSKKIGVSASYGALFPFLTVGYNYTLDRRFYNQNRFVYFNESEFIGGFSIPLNTSKGRNFTFFNIGSQYIYNQSHIQSQFKKNFKDLSYSYINNYFTFSNQLEKAQQQIYPSFAQTILLQYKTPLTNVRGYQTLANGNFYFPGILKTHSLVFNVAWAKKDTLNLINFSSGFPFSRGYNAANFPAMFKWGFNYHFPIIYPDKGFSNILYLMRVRLNPFYDHTTVSGFNTQKQSFKNEFRSAGSEIFFDTKWWNQVNISFGARYSYLLDNDLPGNTGHNRWEIILPINILDN